MAAFFSENSENSEYSEYSDYPDYPDYPDYSDSSNGCKSRARPNSGKRTAKDKVPAATLGLKEVGGKSLA